MGGGQGFGLRCLCGVRFGIRHYHPRLAAGDPGWRPWLKYELSRGGKTPHRGKGNQVVMK